MPKITHISIFLLSILFCQIAYSQDIEIWGTTTSGGNALGTIFSTGDNGDNHVLEHEFQGISLRSPAFTEFIEVDTGLLYGTTIDGGEYGPGGLFSYNYLTKEYNKLYDFANDLVKGYYAGGSLTLLPNGNVYGTTTQGGTGGKGTIWMYDRTNEEFNKILDFDTATIGYLEIDGLLLANDGMLYGVAGGNWFQKSAYLFRLDPSNHKLTKLYTTTDSTQGWGAQSRLMQGSNGKLYGTTRLGGKFNMGVIFEFDLSDSTWIAKHHFNDTCGKNPTGHLTEAGNGRCFGMTAYGGINNEGVFYEYDFVKDTFICRLKYNSNSLGSKPLGNNLMKGSNGKIYGMTMEGGGWGSGALFEFDMSNNNYKVVLGFSNLNAGILPGGTLFEASDGKFYGATTEGTKHGNGSIFSFDPRVNSIKVLDYFFDFTQGASPQGKLLDHSNGLLYGATAGGGEFDDGVLYSFDPNSKIYQVLFHFNGKDGSYPTGYLMEGENNIIYGTTLVGGQHNNGVIFTYDPSSMKYELIVDFKKETTGSRPESGLIGYSDGKYYGMNSIGGKYGSGTLYNVNPLNNEIKVLFDFNKNDSSGSLPWGNLTQLPNGMLYGVTFGGGLKDYGTIFSFNPSLEELKFIHHFTAYNTGFSPRAGLRPGPNGLLYGTAGLALFSIDPVNKSYNVLAPFSDKLDGLGRYPFGELLWASNNKMYGTTSEGALYNDGAIFEYDPVTQLTTKKIDFNTEIGTISTSSLIEINGLRLSVEESEIPKTNISIYPNPSGGRYEISFDSYQDEGFIEVLNLQGAILASYSIQNSKKEIIDISNLSSGLYLLHIRTEGVNETVRIMKE